MMDDMRFRVLVSEHAIVHLICFVFSLNGFLNFLMFQQNTNLRKLYKKSYLLKHFFSKCEKNLQTTEICSYFTNGDVLVSLLLTLTIFHTLY